MTETSPGIAPTNRDVAERLGLTHSGVSRLRTGDRLASVPTMSRIEAVYGWSIQDQVEARAAGKYAEQLEAVLAKGPKS